MLSKYSFLKIAACVFLPGLALVVEACPTATPTCTPNRSLECACGESVFGYQVCQEDGIWGECICDEPAENRCGDNIISESGGEECDDGDTLTSPCEYGLTECHVCSGSCLTVSGETTYCGDQSIDNPNSEECDDGNQIEGDGCDATCRVEASDTCGDSVINGEDQCDDGNLTNLDGCNAACSIETGWTCEIPGSPCISSCGDNIVAAGAEECDDGNTTPGDGCDDLCQNEPCPETLLLTYQINGKFRITDTTFGAGDSEADTSPGELVIRVQSSNGVPVDGPVSLVSVNFESHFVVDTSLGPTVTTDVVTSTPSDFCGIASGALTGGNIEWDECTYGSGHGTTGWTPDDAAEGDGCLRDYHSEGIINCDGSDFVCGQGDLSPGDNVQNDTWNQPYNSFIFETDLASFEMGDEGGPPGSSDNKGTEIPNRSPSRTWLRLSGIQTSSIAEPTPGCLSSLPACQ